MASRLKLIVCCQILSAEPENWTVYKADEETVPAIVSEELWEKANSIYNERILYTTELDMIIKEAYDELIENRSEII